ncbi:tRNA (adenosine(37)-N6)-threonylcarbamoyltransferase complex dimerization subunit type 1 TsaB [Thioalkalivibrio sp. XN279]|uniref:tRNA (adenosine(37)-N6)-threonylcarbamoyltransferase complex dimerization subunit type 1 TsaB n=1 Tax=Thioalkalivibrio sp. XN279 TaxID=2714953 RepID=UPI00140C124E|nr:tRNA (adenosine(37)-N6)-threonylcarbamoyltransferase complex dimerization subunit type 1 TsaB [Thioalkalivibrio sp. XN279]NHA15319.1 tRNA (adenosine(37)-N6)-threonylcarbamoyltransferase complex dimerization subunit type 1 TsaB [Thioalkalivibrio sp. XN279]
MKILALDTAANACSVALQAGEDVIERIETQPRRHAAALLPMAEACLADAGLTLKDLDAVAFGRGPGSFTGLRIAASVAQGIAFGAGLPVAPVSNLAAAAVAAWRKHGWRQVLAAFDARMDELYAAAYRIDDAGLPALSGAEQLVVPAALAPPAGVGAWFGAGSGFAAWDELAGRLGLAGCDPLVEPVARDLLGPAAAMVAAGRTVSADQALPVYLREQVAWQGR